MSGRAPCRSRSHFVRCVEIVEGQKERVRWKCDHCEEFVFNGKQFRSRAARVHLAADKTDGTCSKLCTATDVKAVERRLEFQQLIAKLLDESKAKARKRKQEESQVKAAEVEILGNLNKKKRKTKQCTLGDLFKGNEAKAADIAVAEWAIAHDIPANALSGIFWTTMNKKLAKVAPNYKPVNPQKLNKVLLPMLKEVAVARRQLNLSHAPTVGRTLTGDGATKRKVPLINFLVHIAGRGITLLDVTDCTDHMTAGGIKDAL